MADPATPGQEGPSYGPPSLPQGWIPQWDGTRKKYYYVQLSTGASQWETPTQEAPTVGTPTPTPGQETSPFPQPGQQNVSQDGERGFTSMAVNQLLHSQTGGHSGKPSNPLLGMAGQLLGSGGHNQTHQQTSNAGAVGIVGALAGSLLGGKTKPNQGPQQSYSGQASQGAYGQHQDGLMGKIGGIFGGTSSGHQNNFGYSETGQHQGGYTGQAPPSSYQPTGNQSIQGYSGQAPPSSYQATGSSNTHGYSGPAPVSSYQATSNQPAQVTGTYYNTQQSSYNQNSQGSSQPGTIPYYNSQQQSYPPNSQGGSNSGPHQYYNTQQSQQQPMYGAPQQQQHPQAAYGGPHQQQQQQIYDGAPQQQQQQQQQQPYGTGQQQEPYPSPIYASPATGNSQQPQHHILQGFHPAPHQSGLYGDQGAPPHPPMGSHPNNGQGYPPPPPGQGGPHDMSGYGRVGW